VKYFVVVCVWFNHISKQATQNIEAFWAKREQGGEEEGKEERKINQKTMKKWTVIMMILNMCRIKQTLW
jgi:hypothetical protein